ncbi:MAG: ribosome silencing factor [Opitutaceae bacterium]
MKAAAKGSRRLVKALCRALGEKKAEDLRVLDVSAQSSITDYLVLATGNSEPHLRALRIEAERVFDETDTHVVGAESVQESGWIVLDAFDVMVHLFTAPMRAHFHLENLWRDAAEVPVAKLAAPSRCRKTV